MSNLVAVALEWLAAQGVPNWLFLIALLTSPWTWSDKLRERIGPLLDLVLPSGSKATVAETPDDDPRE